jgi:hypothetical protein
LRPAASSAPSTKFQNLIMASCLSAEARVAIAGQLRDEADALAPPYDRHALH